MPLPWHPVNSSAKTENISYAAESQYSGSAGNQGVVQDEQIWAGEHFDNNSASKSRASERSSNTGRCKAARCADERHLKLERLGVQVDDANKEWHDHEGGTGVVGGPQPGVPLAGAGFRGDEEPGNPETNRRAQTGSIPH